MKQNKEASTKGKPVNFIITESNQKLMAEYEDRLPPGTGIQPTLFYNMAVEYFLTYNMPSNQE